MSIELIGPQGYEYQYLATLFIALTYLRERQDIQLIVEKAGGEDAELKIINGTKEITVEIQVKSTREDLKILELAQWLTHFPDNESNNNLLDRLESDDDRFVLFITRARAMDSVRPFLADFIGINTNAFNNQLLTSAIEHIRTTYGEGSKLEQKRALYCVEQANNYNSHRPKLRSVLKKVLVWEQREEEVLKNNCIKILNNSFVVPHSMTGTALLQLLDLIKLARNRRKDVIPSIIQLLDSFNGERIPLNHVSVKRQADIELMNKFETTNVLLLTGISFCGKTHIAREIASNYQEKGYRCIIESDIKEATRFLNQISIEDRLCLIEDPFGQVELEVKYYEVWAELSDLITRSTPNKKIIVTSKIELLRGISRGDDPDQWMIHGHRWNDLTVTSHEFVIDIWETYCNEKKIPENVYHLVKNNLTNTSKENLLQPGQLRYLAYNDISNLQGKDFSQLIELATFDAQKLGMYFGNKSDNFRKTLIALGLGASPRQAINTEELSFILSDSDAHPSIIILEDDSYKSMNFPGEETPPPSFPTCDVTTLQDWVLDQLDELESHGYISIINNKIRFTHPTYHEAAKYVILHQPRLRLRSMEGIIWKGVSCLETGTALSFTKYLNKLYQVYVEYIDFQKRIISFAINGLNSIFPSVRDASLGLLISHIDHLDNEIQLKVFNYVKHADIDNERLLWHDGEPWIEITDTYNFLDRIPDMLSQNQHEDIDIVANRLINPAETHTVSSEEAWSILSSGFLFEKFDENLILINQLLSYKESFIREKIAFTFMDQFCEGQNELIAIVFGDEHPNVIFQAIRGALNGWHSRSADSKMYLLSHMKEAMLNKIIAAKANRFMVDFGDEYGADSIERNEIDTNQKKDLWEAWSELFAVFLQSVPDKFVSVDEYHLFNTVTSSINNISSDKVVQVCESWLDWIERNIQNSMLYEAGYAISDYLLAGTQPELREHLTTRILNQQDTNFLTVSLAEYINQWDHLSEREQGEILSLLLSQRIDVQWLKAVSLTRTIVSPEILSAILGEEKKNILAEDIDGIIEKFPSDLLVDCIRVYIGHPQPLWWLGYHHARLTKWPEIILRLIELPNHPAFTIATQNFVSRFIMGYFKGEIRKKVVEIWGKHIRSNEDDVINLVFDTLRIQCISYNGPDSEDLWVSFFDNIDRKKKEHYLGRVIEEIEAYSYFNDLEEIFGKNILFNQILPRVQVDFTTINFMILSGEMISKEVDPEILQATYEFLIRIYTEEKPRLALTNKIAKRFSKKFLVNVDKENKLLALIEQMEKQCSETGRIIKEKLSDHYDLENWISVHK